MAEGTAALGVHLIDLGKGAERYKQTLKSHELYVAEGMVARGTLLAGAHRVRSNAIDWARPRIKRHPRVLRGIDQLLRHFGRIS
jgi:CelD/BcsL family acetyltransferase involved in cellulose biosynthesis